MGSLLDAATRRLREAGASSARLDSELLLGHVAGLSRTQVLTHPEHVLTTIEADAFEELVGRRVEAEPMAYLLGEREFYGHLFAVDRRALIPRPETELLVELGVAAVARSRARGIEPRVLEIGTGAGAVAISLALAARVSVEATDVSGAALELAEENARRLDASRLVRFVEADLLAGVEGSFDVVLANLPYVPDERVLPADVAEYEPHVAIFGGPLGTELIARLLHEARGRLRVGGELAVELDEEEQARPVAELARALYVGAGVEILRDAGGYERVVRVRV